MKIFNLFAGLLSLMVLMTGCEQTIQVESVVHEDGSIDRTIIFSKTDSNMIANNFFGIKPENGWEVSVTQGKADTATKKTTSPFSESNKTTITTFRKTFNSAEEANREMNTDADTLFRIRSDFEKKFRWFYTYIKYSDTYISCNRFRNAPINDYLTQEDYAFIERLPAEGKTISKADSIYGEKLGEKIFEDLYYRAIYTEHYDGMLKFLANHQYDQQSMDSLRINREKYYRRIIKNIDKQSDSPIFSDFNDDEDFMIGLIKNANLPAPPDEVIKEYQSMIAELEKRTNFMGTILDSKFTHVIKLPWPVISTNADSVARSSLYWRPSFMKYLVKDYTMYAEVRKLNYWAVAVSALVIFLTIFVFMKRKRRVSGHVRQVHP